MFHQYLPKIFHKPCKNPMATFLYTQHIVSKFKKFQMSIIYDFFYKYFFQIFQSGTFSVYHVHFYKNCEKGNLNFTIFTSKYLC